MTYLLFRLYTESYILKEQSALLGMYAHVHFVCLTGESWHQVKLTLGSLFRP